MRIRRARLADIKELTKLQSLLMKHHMKFDGYWDVKRNAKSMYSKYFIKMIKSPNAVMFVAEDNGKIIGFTLGKIKKRPPIFKIERVGQVNSTFVLEKYRKKGITKRLTNELFEWFKSKKIYNIELDVDNRNLTGLKVWKRLKFDRYLITKKRKI